MQWSHKLIGTEKTTESASSKQRAVHYASTLADHYKVSACLLSLFSSLFSKCITPSKVEIGMDSINNNGRGCCWGSIRELRECMYCMCVCVQERWWRRSKQSWPLIRMKARKKKPAQRAKEDDDELKKARIYFNFCKALGLFALVGVSRVRERERKEKEDGFPWQPSHWHCRWPGKRKKRQSKRSEDQLVLYGLELGFKLVKFLPAASPLLLLSSFPSLLAHHIYVFSSDLFSSLLATNAHSKRQLRRTSVKTFLSLNRELEGVQSHLASWCSLIHFSLWPL